MNNITVNKISLQDVEEYIVIFKNFHSKFPIKEFVNFDYNSFKIFLENAIEKPDIAILSCKQDNKIIGITGGFLFPMYFNHSYKVVQELWWWVEEEYRGSKCGRLLYNALQEWAKEKKASSVFMVALEDENISKMVTVYKQKGYTEVERTFIKELNNGN